MFVVLVVLSAFVASSNGYVWNTTVNLWNSSLESTCSNSALLCSGGTLAATSLCCKVVVSLLLIICFCLLWKKTSIHDTLLTVYFDSLFFLPCCVSLIFVDMVVEFLSHYRKSGCL